jgi:hypothetical protein
MLLDAVIIVHLAYFLWKLYCKVIWHIKVVLIILQMSEFCKVSQRTHL